MRTLSGSTSTPSGRLPRLRDCAATKASFLRYRRVQARCLRTALFLSGHHVVILRPRPPRRRTESRKPLRPDGIPCRRYRCFPSESAPWSAYSRLLPLEWRSVKHSTHRVKYLRNPVRCASSSPTESGAGDISRRGARPVATCIRVLFTRSILDGLLNEVSPFDHVTRNCCSHISNVKTTKRGSELRQHSEAAKVAPVLERNSNERIGSVHSETGEYDDFKVYCYCTIEYCAYDRDSVCANFYYGPR